ncbi:MAG: tRNA (adenosine(37)-N6)-threonylcarbamoyltransferase complex transferase subunit TsaD [bacterium]|nr:tRNA (adenosine(37)-N6)-threonylcarbamoyltransferase complex transferase subunit TsaD [bacterium]
MNILAIETSCDETSAAVVKDGVEVLSNVVASSQELHQKTGGIVPEVAAREQGRCLLPVLQEALEKAFGPKSLAEQMTMVDAAAVTYGPGLIGSLLVGVEAAKTLAWFWNKPLIPVNHLEGHIYANWLADYHAEIQFPAIVLLVSGGHTEILLMEGHQKISRLGGTLDDAAGEAFDKAARILGLGYPGGPAIGKKAAEYTGTEGGFLPRPLHDSDSFDFSYSGLKTALLREFTRRKGDSPTLPPEQVALLAKEFEEAATDVLVDKTLKAATKVGAKAILLAGGVAANRRLRDKIGDSAVNVKAFTPPLAYCTDNAAMVASAAFFHYSPQSPTSVAADPSLEI